MEQQTYSPETERACPVGLVLVPTFVGALLWLIAMVNRLSY